MSPLIRFAHISKKYHLGLTRVSMPALVGRAFGRTFQSRSKVEQDEVLWALNDVSFELGRGESLALLGPNGAGKTTILKLLARITEPTRGKLDIHGRLSALIELGAGFHPELTGRDNIFLNGAILGMTRGDVMKRLDEIVEFSGVERFIDTPVKRYSSGMIVRLGFAVASCVEPEVLLVDEVLAVGDASFSQRCLTRIRSLIDQGTGLVFVSHNLYQVKAVCRKAIYLRGGSIRCAGDTDGVMRAYEQDLHQERAERTAQTGRVQVGLAGEIEITSVDVVPFGQPPSALPLSNSEPIEIRIGYSAYADLGPVNVSVFVRRSDGLACCMLRTNLDAVDVRISRGSGVVSLCFETLPLISGSYFAEAYILDDTDSLTLTPDGRQSPWFSVAGRGISSSGDSGVFEPIATWVHKPGVMESHVPQTHAARVESA